MVQETVIDKAIDGYGKAYLKLWEQVKANPHEFPSGVVSAGTIAEYYAKKYLENKYEGTDVSFGSPNEKAWDIRVTSSNGMNTLYQVKSISLFNKSRKLSPLVKGFDRLIVISMDCDFFPFQVYLFKDASVLFGENRVTALTVPNPDSGRETGSKVFSFAENIHEEFLRPWLIISNHSLHSKQVALR